ncbi:PAS domain S-box protein [bacterium]|nr:MAG: PAS domain S-box protein [bacterium]
MAETPPLPADETALLESRTSRPPDYRSESEALRQLVSELAESPEEILPAVVRMAMERCGAQSAGLNVAETDEEGKPVFRCRATTGEYAAYLDRATPRERSLCRMVVDRAATQLFLRPDRYDPSFANEVHPIVEILLTPVLQDGRIFGTLWVVTHDEDRRFDGEDRRMLESLAGFASVAWISETGRRALAESEAEARIAQAESDRLNEEVRAERERLLALVKDAPAFVATMTGRNLKFEYVNEAYYSIVGHRPVVGLDLLQALPELEGQGYLEILLEVMDTGVPFVAEERPVMLQRAPGGPLEERFVNLVYQPSRDRSGAITGILTHGVDITDQVRAREVLARSEARYRTLFDSIEEGFVVLVMVFDEAGKPVDYRFREFNDAFSQLTGIPAEWARDGVSAREAVPGLEEFWFETYGRVATTGEAIRFENRAEPMGKWFDVHAFRIGGDESNEVGVLFQDISARRAADQELREATDLLQRITDGTDELIVAIDPEYRFTRFNESYSRDFSRVFGRDPKVGESLMDLLAHLPEDQANARSMWSRALAGENVDMTAEFGDPGRARRFFDLRFYPLRNSEGEIVGAGEIARDVTDREKLTAELRTEREKLQTLFELAPAFIAVLQGPDLVFEYVNDAYYTLIGHREVVGRPLAEAIPETVGGDFGQDYDRVLQAVLNSGESFTYDARPVMLQRKPEGELEERFLDLSYQPLREADGAVTGVLVHGVDVTDQTRSREELRRSERRQTMLLRLLEGQRESGDPLEMMRAASQALGLHLKADRVSFFEMPDDDTLDFSVGWSAGPLKLLTGSFPTSRLGNPYLEEIRTGRTLGIEDARTHPLTRDSEFGASETIALIGAPIFRNGRWVAGIYVNHGEPRAWTDEEIGLVREVADQTWVSIERARAEDALRVANQTLETKVADRTRELQETVREAEGFNYSISHDLRAPLRAIAATSSILMEDLGSEIGHEHQQLLRRQVENAQRLGRLIDELLRLSRLARVPVNSVPLDITRKAREVATECGCHVEVQEEMTAEGDPGLVRTVLQNLIGNACKFSPSQGTVRVTQQGNVITVSDEGIGFDMAYASKIFLPFERLVTDAEFPGTGIGLANVERIVRRHGGKVWAESEPGKGARFSFTLS